MPEFTAPQLLALARDALSTRPKMYKTGGTVEHKGVSITHAELSPQAVDGGAVFHPDHLADGGPANSEVIPHGDPQREENLTAFNPVRDENGDPKVLYHGTTGNFGQFSDKLKGSSTNAKSASLGHWFTDVPRVAQSYAHYAATDVPIRKFVEAAEKAGKKQDWDAHDKYMAEAEELDSHFRNPENEKRGQNIMPVHLSMKNPHVIDANGGDFNDLEGGLTNHIMHAKRNGHDGLIVKNLDDAAGLAHMPATHYMVFHPHQIKSAIGNQGTFDPKSPDITKARGGEVPHMPHPAMRIPGVHIVTSEAGEPFFHG